MSTPTNTTTTTTAATPTAMPKKKQYKDIYEGSAEIVSVEPTELRFTDGLTEDEIANGFLIAIRFKPNDEKVGEITMELEFSDRESKQREYVGKKQKDVTRDELFKQKLIAGADAASANIAEVFDTAIGKKVQIRIVEVTDPNKAENNVRRNVYFSNRPAVLSAAERARRIAALTGQPVAAPAAAKPVTQNPF